MPRSVLFAILVLPLLAGCLQPAAQEGLAPAGGPLASPVLVPGAPAQRWNGSDLAAQGGPGLAGVARYACWVEVQCPDPDVPCDEGRNCQRIPFRVNVPPGHWETREGAVDVSIRWPTGAPQWLVVRIEDASGAVLAWGHNHYVGATGKSAVLLQPPSGDYVAVVLAQFGKGGYEGSVELESRARGAPHERMPDLVTLPPTDLTLETPDYSGAGYFVLPVHPLLATATEAAGAKGCRVDEVAEAGERRCLRFSNAVGNVGEGPLEVRLAPDAAGAMRFTQRVYDTEGGFREVQAGPAEWHATHAHWHNAAANRFTVHPYDPATGVLGEPVGEGRKAGVCFADTGLIDLDLAHSAPAHYSGYACVDPRAQRAWVMGLSPTWYDLYPYILSDQYVDIQGLEDGTYQLCSTTNMGGLLVEADPTNNEACTAFRLAGDEVEVLAPAPYHAMRGDAP